MKLPITLIFGLFFFFSIQLNAKSWRVNNTLSIPEQVDFSELTIAVQTASAGDTIYVEGSSIAYEEGAVIDRQLTIIGPGILLQNNPDICNNLVADVRSITFESGSDGSFISGLTLLGNNTTVRFSQTTVLISNVTITRCHLENIFSNADMSNITVSRNLFCDGVYLYNNDVDNFHFYNNLIRGSIDRTSSTNFSNCNFIDNTFRGNTFIDVSGSVIENNYVGVIGNQSDNNNISVKNNILDNTSNSNNISLNQLDSSNQLFPYDDTGWGCDDDNWMFSPSDQSDEHGAYNGIDPYPVPNANFPAWPVIESCTIPNCGDQTIQVQFQVRSNQ